MNKINQKSLVAKVLDHIKSENLIKTGDVIIVALSGGPDSVCLLNVLEEIKEKLNFNLLACHYNHKLRGGESEKDKNFVEKICAQKGIECVFGEAPEKKLYKNEEEAREARYAFFEKILGERRGAKIVIAHNSNDFIETFLMRLFRGTGIRGLISIPSAREKKFIRPLLSVKREEIEDYLTVNKLVFRIDKTNFDLSFTRNFVRLKILPLIKKINPNIIETIYNSGKVLEDDYNLLLEMTQKEFDKIILKQDNSYIIIDYKGYLMLHPSLQRSVIRLAIEKKKSLLNITIKQLEEVRSMLLKGEGKKFKLLPHSLRIELESGKIIISDNAEKAVKD